MHQFRLASLFVLTAIAALFSFSASFLREHWDLRSVYLGYYGPDDIPGWASGSGADQWAESVGVFLRSVVDYGWWFVAMAAMSFAGAAAVQAKGGAR